MTQWPQSRPCRKQRRVIDTYRETAVNTLYTQWVSTDETKRNEEKLRTQIQEISKKIEHVEHSTKQNPEEKHELLQKKRKHQERSKRKSIQQN
jgi:hypothetical protein